MVASELLAALARYGGGGFGLLLLLVLPLLLLLVRRSPISLHGASVVLLPSCVSPHSSMWRTPPRAPKR